MCHNRSRLLNSQWLSAFQSAASVLQLFFASVVELARIARLNSCAVLRCVVHQPV
jgi:hypothetical protein